MAGTATQDIEHLRQLGRTARQVDWERLLTINYRAYLDRGCSIIDVGAHHGMHSRRFVRYLRPAHLVLVEPIPEMAAGLRHEFRRRPEVTVRQVALSHEAGSSTFVVNDAAPGESGLKERRYTGASRPRIIDITVERLDDWHLPYRVDFIKVDVEGGEVDVLRGAAELLAKDRPVVSVEYGEGGFGAYGHDVMTMHDLATTAGYVPLDLFGNVLTADDWPDVVNAFYWDFILLPTERVEASVATRAKIRKRAMWYASHPHPTIERWRKRLRW